ncbi:hypothetical protein P8452_04668 [Trifolium repens]|nr:hypothetical protein P8452_04668 [Trifolium repens]
MQYLKTGNLPVSRLCLYCLSQMIVGLEKVALYRWKFLGCLNILWVQDYICAGCVYSLLMFKDWRAIPMV